MNYPIEAIEGIGETFGKKLREAGITGTQALLKAGAARSGRRDLAGQTGIEERRLLEWVNRADLMRIRGVGTQFADLLEAAGVDTVKELRTRNAASLAGKIAELNAAKKLTRTVPNEKQITAWIEAAKGLDAVVSH